MSFCLSFIGSVSKPTIHAERTFSCFKIVRVTSAVEIRDRNWSAVFFEDRTFCRLLIAYPLKMYSKFG